MAIWGIYLLILEAPKGVTSLAAIAKVMSAEAAAAAVAVAVERGDSQARVTHMT